MLMCSYNDSSGALLDFCFPSKAHSIKEMFSPQTKESVIEINMLNIFVKIINLNDQYNFMANRMERKNE